MLLKVLAFSVKIYPRNCMMSTIRSTWDPKTFDWELLDVIRCHFMIQDFHCGLNNNLQTLLCKQVLLLKRLYSFKRKLLFLLLMKILRTTSLFANSFHILHIFGKNKVLCMFVYLYPICLCGLSIMTSFKVTKNNFFS